MAFTPIPPPSGEMIDVGGYRLHVECMGKSGPLVIFDSGLGDLPVFWLTADWWSRGKQTPTKTAMMTLRAEAQALSTRSRHIIAIGCDHTDLPIVRADAVAEAVQVMIDGRE